MKNPNEISCGINIGLLNCGCKEETGETRVTSSIFHPVAIVAIMNIAVAGIAAVAPS